MHTVAPCDTIYSLSVDPLMTIFQGLVLQIQKYSQMHIYINVVISGLLSWLTGSLSALSILFVCSPFRIPSPECQRQPL